MPTLRELTEKRTKIYSDMRAVADGAADGWQTDFDRLEGEYNEIDAQVRRFQALEEMERRSQGQHIAGTGDDRFDEALKGFSLIRAIASQVPDLAGQVDAGKERELSAEVARRAGRQFEGMAVPMSIFEKRVVTTGTPVDGRGSNLIGNDLREDQYINLLYAALVTQRMGARVLRDLRGNVSIPKGLYSATGTWVAENNPIPLSDMGFGQVNLTPKHVGARTEFSRNMLQQSSVDVEQLARADFAAILARAVDAAAIAGNGVAPVPRGILNTPDVPILPLGTNGGALTWEAVLDLIGALEDAGIEGTGFVGNGKISRAARAALKTTGLPGYLMDAPGNLAGYPYASTNLIPANGAKGSGTGLSALIFGRWSDLLLGYWSEFDLLVNPYESTAYAKGNVQIRGMVTMDVAVRYPESFAAVTDIVT